MTHLEPYVELKRPLSFTETIADTKRAQIMDVVRHALYDYGDLDPLAIKIGRSHTCLYAIRRGKTRWPRWDTLLSLLPHLGLELTVQRMVRH